MSFKLYDFEIDKFVQIKKIPKVAIFNVCIYSA